MPGLEFKPWYHARVTAELYELLTNLLHFLCLFNFLFILFFFNLFYFRGLSPEEADLQYLKFAASKLVMYGVDAHPARVKDYLCC